MMQSVNRTLMLKRKRSISLLVIAFVCSRSQSFWCSWTHAFFEKAKCTARRQLEEEDRIFSRVPLIASPLHPSTSS